MSTPSELPIALYKVKNGKTQFTKDTYDFTLSNLTKTKPNNKLKCMARKTNKEQCNRNKKDNTDYCSCHNKSRPNGRIDEEPYNKDQQPTPKKRGPKFKNKQLAINNINLDLYQKIRLIKIDDNQYYIDDNGILYAKDDSGNIIGHKEQDFIKWFK